MRAWDLAVPLEPSAGTPLFLQIARAVAADVRRGRLRPGDPLPGSRTLARTLGVHRNTVLAAYRELEAEGWITTRPAGATLVSRALPDPAPRRFGPLQRDAVPERVGFDLPPAPPSFLPPSYGQTVLALASGIPDLRLVPVEALARAYRRALRRRTRDTLGYGDPRGHATLRSALAAMLARLRGLAVSENELMVTRGSQMALDLVARALLAPGDVVAVEAMGYPPAWGALRQAGAKLVPVPVDGEGVVVEALEELAARRRVRAIYVTPHHQYPTTAVLSAGRRLRLLELARARRLAIIEDDFDYEFHYEGRPVLPLASADPAGVVVYIGTLSKILAPGLRLGFVVAPRPLVDRLAALRMMLDRQGDLSVECAIAELLEDGEVQRHAQRMRRVYQARRDALASALRNDLAEALDFEVPAGGMALWAKAARGIDIDAWARRALQRGVAFQVARAFTFDGKSRPFARLGFAARGEPELREAVRRMAAAL